MITWTTRNTPGGLYTELSATSIVLVRRIVTTSAGKFSYSPREMKGTMSGRTRLSRVIEGHEEKHRFVVALAVGVLTAIALLGVIAGSSGAATGDIMRCLGLGMRSFLSFHRTEG